MRNAAKCITVLVLVLSLGLHWALLQTVAWTGMMINYSRSTTLLEAAAMTFNGQHPCCLCKAVADGKQAEKKNDLLPGLKKVDFVTPEAVAVFAPQLPFTLLPDLNLSFAAIPSLPPVPPPRNA